MPVRVGDVPPISAGRPDGPLITGGNGITRIIFPTGAPTFPRKTTNRHTYGVVYANDIALQDIDAKSRLHFKPGAVVVREKLAGPDSKTPDLLAVMIKREPGFNPRANDWEFLIVNGDATKIRRREKRGACFECHRSQKDFVYGNYEKK